MSSRDLSALDRTVFQPLARILQEAFQYGIENDIILGENLTGTAQDINEVSDTQNYALGTKRIYGNKVFYYSKSGGACWTGRGAKTKVAISDGIDFTLLGATSAVGSTSLTFAAATHPAFTANELKGGLVLISDQDSGDTQDKMVQQRICVGNATSEEDAACIITIDKGLTREVTAATYAFVMPSPFSNVAYGTADTESVIGVPADYVSASDKYFWLQTWGPCWLAPQDEVGKTSAKRSFVFRHDGSLDSVSDGGTSPVTDQIGGYILDDNAAANGATFVMLTLCP